MSLSTPIRAFRPRSFSSGALPASENGNRTIERKHSTSSIRSTDSIETKNLRKGYLHAKLSMFTAQVKAQERNLTAPPPNTLKRQSSITSIKSTDSQETIGIKKAIKKFRLKDLLTQLKAKVAEQEDKTSQYESNIQSRTQTFAPEVAAKLATQKANEAEAQLRQQKAKWETALAEFKHPQDISLGAARHTKELEQVQIDQASAKRKHQLEGEEASVKTVQLASDRIEQESRKAILESTADSKLASAKYDQETQRMLAEELRKDVKHSREARRDALESMYNRIG
jgi:hypothetical protein